MGLLIKGPVHTQAWLPITYRTQGTTSYSLVVAMHLETKSSHINTKSYFGVS